MTQDRLIPGSNNDTRDEIPTIAVYSPFPTGGMPGYTRDFMLACAADCSERIRLELVTSEDIDPEYRDVPYRVNAILPALNRSEFSHRLAWGMSRVRHHLRSEETFFTWLKGRPDVSAVHFQDYHPWMTPSSITRSQSLGKATFFTVHNIYPHAYPIPHLRRPFDSISRARWRSCDALFVLSESLKRRLSAFLGSGHPPIEVVPHGISSVPPTVSIPCLSTRMNRKRVLFFGTIRSNKGLHVLLEAMRGLSGFALTIAGSREQTPYWKNEIEPRLDRAGRAGVSIAVNPGYFPDECLPGLFLDHSVLALPYTEFASQSGVLHLAIAYEVPVVATDVGSLGETVGQFGIGEVVRPGDPDAFAAAVRRLHAYDEEERGRLEGNLQKAKSQLQWSTAARVAMKAYGRALSQNTR